MIQVHYPPVTPFIDRNSLKVFLAGTINKGNSPDWQKELIEYITKCFVPSAPVDIFNPRRPDWDNSWDNSPSHPMFKRQVEWELERLETCDLPIMAFMPKVPAPISLLELGLFKDKIKLVYNPHDFPQYGNVEITCRRYGVQTVYDWDYFLIAAKRLIDSYITKLTKHA